MGALLTDMALDTAAGYLDRNVARAYDLASRWYGFGCIAVPNAPTTLERLTNEAHYCADHSCAFRVSSLHLDKAIMPARTFHWLRFVHDLKHVELRAPLDYDGEQAVFRAVAKLLDVHPVHQPEDLVDRLYWADQLGQAMFEQITGRYPEDQKHFVYQVVKSWHQRGWSLWDAVQEYAA